MKEVIDSDTLQSPWASLQPVLALIADQPIGPRLYDLQYPLYIATSAQAMLASYIISSHPAFLLCSLLFFFSSLCLFGLDQVVRTGPVVYGDVLAVC